MCESVLNHSHPLRSLELLRLPESPSPSSSCSRVCCSSRGRGGIRAKNASIGRSLLKDCFSSESFGIVTCTMLDLIN
ncbi:hypothetical protein F8388_009501 [Cannabis sativa]|uniref:Uncharacterized protein n=1 Tax=Cannabis sativa TaxID=3483 RepID=A0A7J6EIF2_CANSA|nr:hypothetical protein F8388_009501 [Cannabis sativa]KAF4387050.1 hypothetical protein G4B88_024622 [Cannabis sativa]